MLPKIKKVESEWAIRWEVGKTEKGIVQFISESIIISVGWKGEKRQEEQGLEKREKGCNRRGWPVRQVEEVQNGERGWGKPIGASWSWPLPMSRLDEPSLSKWPSSTASAAVSHHQVQSIRRARKCALLVTADNRVIDSHSTSIELLAA